MNMIRNFALSALLLGGMTAGAAAQLPDPIEPDPGVEPEWVTLGIASFDQIEEESVHVGEWRARNLDMIALQPLTADIACMEMKVSIDGVNGTQDIPIQYESELNEDWIYKLPIRGEDRNVTGIELTCRSVAGAPAIVQLYGIPDGVGEDPGAAPL